MKRRTAKFPRPRGKGGPKTDVGKAKALKNLKRGGSPFLHVVPAPPVTDESAEVFVKCLAAGMPARDAVAVVDPGVRKLAAQEQKRYIALWQSHPLVKVCSDVWMKKPWHELPQDTRLQLAQDVHLAQLAYFLMSHHYAHLEGSDLDKADRARDALTKYLVSKRGDDTPFAAIMRRILAGELAAADAFEGPPRMVEGEVLGEKKPS